MIFASELPFYSDQYSTEPFFAEEKTKAQTAETELTKLRTEMAEMKKEYVVAMAKQKEIFEAKIVKMEREHETELEESAVQVNDARIFAQKANRTLLLAKRDLRRAKESFTLQAERLKEMEAQEDRCLKFLKAMDERLSGKFFLRIPTEVKFSPVFHSQFFPSVFTDAFPAANERAAAAVKQARAQRAEIAQKKHETFDPRWSMEDWLHSLRARTSMLRRRGETLRGLMETTFAALWPDEPFPETLEAFSEKIDAAEDRLSDWRESAARVAADETLSWVVSIYESINLDKLVGCRVKSKWITDPELAEKRTRKAYEIVSRANIHEYAFSIDTPSEEIEAARKLAEEAEAKRRRIEENRYKIAEDDPSRYRRRSGKAVADDEVSEARSSEEGSKDEESEHSDGELGEDVSESSVENFDTEDEETSEGVDEDILADPVPPVKSSASVPPSGGAATTAPSGATTTAPSGGTSTTPSANAPPSPSATA